MGVLKIRILIIGPAALKDLVFCFQSFEDIRRAHPDAEIALLTRAAFADFAKRMPWFNQVIVEAKLIATDSKGWKRMLFEINSFAPTQIFDLHNKRRQTLLYASLGGPFGPERWGVAPWFKFPGIWPLRSRKHFTDFLSAHLRKAGIPAAPKYDLNWLDAPVDKFQLPPNYAVIVPGCSSGAHYKRWLPSRYAELVTALHARGLACVAVGTSADVNDVEQIKTIAPDVLDLCGNATFFELAGIFRRARVVIGNETGQIHLAAAVGVPTLALFSGRSNPIWSKPSGERVGFVQKSLLKDMTVKDVIAALNALTPDLNPMTSSITGGLVENR